MWVYLSIMYIKKPNFSYIEYQISCIHYNNLINRILQIKNKICQNSKPGYNGGFPKVYD